MNSEARLILAVQTASKKLAEGGNFDELLKEVLAICVKAVGAAGGTIYIHSPATSTLSFRYVEPTGVHELLPTEDIPDSFGSAGAAFHGRRTILLDRKPPFGPRTSYEVATGVIVQNMLVAPLALKGERPIGVVQLINKAGGAFDNVDVGLIETIAAVAALAFANHRLSQESARASTLLGMGKVSHDIGNLAASMHATISSSEATVDRLWDSLHIHRSAELADEYLLSHKETLRDLRQTVDRIVGYSGLISDMGAGRTLRPFRRHAPLSDIVAHSASFLESDARSKRIRLVYDIQRDAPHYAHDDLYIFRIVQNLVGNAIKAVTEPPAEVRHTTTDRHRGTVTVRYRYSPTDHLLEVTDTGPGLSEDATRRILAGEVTSQWNQAAGSGWGLRIVTELASSHEGTLEIESAPGRGSTFRVRLPEDPTSEIVEATRRSVAEVASVG